MSQLGLGVMINMLGGNEETVAAYNASVGKEIANIEIKDDHLLIAFTDKSVLDAWDDGQSCCEYRHMSTDDDLAHYIGATLLSLDTKEGPSKEVEYEEHDTEFLEVTTSKGSFTVVNHNEHNGYYGGFYVKLAVR